MKVCNIKLDFAEQNKLLNLRKVGPQSCRIAVKYFLCFHREKRHVMRVTAS